MRIFGLDIGRASTKEQARLFKNQIDFLKGYNSYRQSLGIAPIPLRIDRKRRIVHLDRAARLRKPTLNIPVEDIKADTTLDITPDTLASEVFVSSTRRLRSNVLVYNTEYDLAEPDRLADIDGYVQAAFAKKLALMFKESYDFTGYNPLIVDYVKDRMLQIAIASNLPVDTIMRHIGNSLIRYSNAFIGLGRNAKNSGGVSWVDASGKRHEPISKVELLPAPYMRPVVKNESQLIGWAYLKNGLVSKIYSLEDIIHITYNHKVGMTVGTPVTHAAEDFITMLRYTEDNIGLLIEQYVIPFLHYIVGTPEHPATITPDGKNELDEAKTQLENVAAEGGLVTTERHEIKLLYPEGTPPKIEAFLEHFKRRILAALGISGIDVGETETSNRSTSETLSRALIDGVKDLQATMVNAINFKLIVPLIREMPKDYQKQVISKSATKKLFSRENFVSLSFNEIDLTSKTAKESHIINLWNNNMLSYNEVRAELGRRPIDIPATPEEALNIEQYPDWHSIFFKLVKEPETLIARLDPLTASLVAANSRSLNLTPKDIDTSISAQKELKPQPSQSGKPLPETPAARAAKSKVIKTNQHGSTTGRRQSSVEESPEILDRKPLTKWEINWLYNNLKVRLSTMAVKQARDFDAESAIAPPTGFIGVTQLPVDAPNDEDPFFHTQVGIVLSEFRKDFDKLLREEVEKRYFATASLISGDLSPAQKNKIDELFATRIAPHFRSHLGRLSDSLVKDIAKELRDFMLLYYIVSEEERQYKLDPDTPEANTLLSKKDLYKWYGRRPGKETTTAEDYKPLHTIPAARLRKLNDLMAGKSYLSNKILPAFSKRIQRTGYPDREGDEFLETEKFRVAEDKAFIEVFRLVLDRKQYRVRQMQDHELRSVASMAILDHELVMGKKQALIAHAPNHCNICASKNSIIDLQYYSATSDLSSVDIPPFHPSCECVLDKEVSV